MQHRDEYLNDAHVEGFISYLSGVLSGHTRIDFPVAFSVNRLPRHYEMQCPGKVEREAAGSLYVVEAETLEQLFRCYWWNHRFYDENRQEVDDVRACVQSAIAGEHGEFALELARGACRKVMDWGFGRGTRANESNVSWAMSQGPSLVQVLRNGREALLSDAPDLSVFNRSPDPSTHWSKMNSGWTKYYSFALPAHVIYDSRVGAALCYLVRRYLESFESERQVDAVPESLAFRWAPGQGERNTRDPSSGSYRFARLSGGPAGSREWARVNIQANWILSAAVSKSAATWCSGPEGFRRVEGALFMLGYDLSRVERSQAHDGTESTNLSFQW
ncbi:hypothetical protein K788_0006002 (plasmid) [Paraburkholderia caribensis MBA4]|uniref:Uncharacterized protein n=1 Tax=Paraburkholderia caribensis MBA4 TaxID=1323664 RepID=A0A0P0RRJ6_9BURK|nr:hypothetical protein [Paraburkholderia caribensis]ALL71591.1 hypothetical protein K788_0006002 [Paraburkholderia caribensis MBA4]